MVYFQFLMMITNMINILVYKLFGVCRWPLGIDSQEWNS